jgi:hypothetical protein
MHARHNESTTLKAQRRNLPARQARQALVGMLTRNCKHAMQRRQAVDRLVGISTHTRLCPGCGAPLLLQQQLLCWRQAAPTFPCAGQCATVHCHPQSNGPTWPMHSGCGTYKLCGHASAIKSKRPVQHCCAISRNKRDLHMATHNEQCSNTGATQAQGQASKHNTHSATNCLCTN